MKKMFVVIVLSVMVCVAHADETRGMYGVNVKVIDHSKRVWSQAVRVALRSVLFRVSGKPVLLQSPVIIEAMKTPDRMMTTYRYRTLNDELGQEQLVLQIQFNQKAVKQLLNRAKSMSQPVEQTAHPVVQDVELSIAGINGIDDHVHVVHFLRQFGIVRYVRVNDIKDNVLNVRVSVVGGKSALLAVLSNQQKLVQILNYDDSKTLQFAWYNNPVPQVLKPDAPSVVLPSTPGGENRGDINNATASFTN